MEIHVIRHTQVAVASGICYGQTDVDLRPSFPEDAAVYQDLKGLQFDQIYTSPASRCVRLAKHLNFAAALTETRIQEFHFGDWEMQAWSEIPQEQLTPWMENFDTLSVPGGESYPQMYTRVCEFYEMIKAQPHTRVLWITHAGVIRCLWARILGIPLKNSFKIPVGYGERFVIETAHETILKKG